MNGMEIRGVASACRHSGGGGKRRRCERTFSGRLQRRDDRRANAAEVQRNSPLLLSFLLKNHPFNNLHYHTKGAAHLHYHNKGAVLFYSIPLRMWHIKGSDVDEAIFILLILKFY